MSKTAACWQQKHIQHAPSTKTESDYLYVWMKKKKKQPVTYAKVPPKMVNPRNIDLAGNAVEEEEEDLEEASGPFVFDSQTWVCGCACVFVRACLSVRAYVCVCVCVCMCVCPYLNMFNVHACRLAAHLRCFRSFLYKQKGQAQQGSYCTFIKRVLWGYDHAGN